MVGRKPRFSEQVLGTAVRCALAGPPRAIRPYNGFVRWRKAGVWDRLMIEIAKAHDGRAQMIDTSIVRVHKQGATAKGGIEIIVSVAREVGSHQASGCVVMSLRPRSQPIGAACGCIRAPPALASSEGMKPISTDADGRRMGRVTQSV